MSFITFPTFSHLALLTNVLVGCQSVCFKSFHIPQTRQQERTKICAVNSGLQGFFVINKLIMWENVRAGCCLQLHSLSKITTDSFDI